MQTRFIEAVGTMNWGKFMLGRFDSEWAYKIAMDPGIGAGPGFSSVGLLSSQGWGPEHLMVMDLATGEAAIFRPGGCAHNDLNEKHRIWVCPLFEPFLEWLYEQDVTDLDALPAVVELPHAPAAMYGYRRDGGGE